LGSNSFQDKVFLPIELVVFFYQFSVLIFPTLGPVLILGIVYHIESKNVKL